MNNVSIWIKILIVMMPFVDNINGIMIKFFNLSLIGPLYRIVFLGVLFLIYYNEKSVLTKNKVKVYFILLAMLVWASLHYYLGYSNISNIQSMTKIFLPIILFIVVRDLVDLKRIKIDEIVSCIIISITIYSSFIIFSYIINFKMFARTGYYGFIHAINDLAISYILVFSIFIVKKNYKILIFNILAFALMGSKSMFIFLPYFIFILIKRNKKFNTNHKVKTFIISITMISVGIYIFVFSPIGKQFYQEKEYLKEYNWSYLWEYDRELIYREMTSGRSDFYYDFKENSGSKTKIEWIIGSGDKAKVYTLGKDGVEMDPIDALNNYGIVGLILYIWFYIIKSFRNTNKYFKAILVIVSAYSIFGGHLFNNAISGTYYALIIICANEKYSTISNHRLCLAITSERPT